MGQRTHRLVQGIEWLPCCMGIGFNLYRAYREDTEGTAPDTLTHGQQGLYCAYGLYQLGTLVGVLKGLEALFR